MRPAAVAAGPTVRGVRRGRRRVSRPGVVTALEPGSPPGRHGSGSMWTGCGSRRCPPSWPRRPGLAVGRGRWTRRCRSGSRRPPSGGGVSGRCSGPSSGAAVRAGRPGAAGCSGRDTPGPRWTRRWSSAAGARPARRRGVRRALRRRPRSARGRGPVAAHPGSAWRWASSAGVIDRALAAAPWPTMARHAAEVPLALASKRAAQLGDLPRPAKRRRLLGLPGPSRVHRERDRRVVSR